MCSFSIAAKKTLDISLSWYHKQHQIHLRRQLEAMVSIYFSDIISSFALLSHIASQIPIPYEEQRLSNDSGMATVTDLLQSATEIQGTLGRFEPRSCNGVAEAR